MEFGSNYFSEEDQMSKGKLPFSYSSSSSPSSSSSQQKGTELSGALPQIYEKRQMGLWLGNKMYDSEEDNETAGAASVRLELMDVNDDGEEEDSNNNNNNKKQGGEENMNVVIEKEHMFDKVVTPSDVGKLNRLVIPKQYAEKYFPLDSSTNEKGLLLNFEDRNGKDWRFRYSYWNSSQSYVMTKGWSRFVKEKKLDPGDIVSFQRGVGELGKDRFYIDWRRRPDAPDPASHHRHHHQQPYHFPSIPWSPQLMRPPPVAAPLLQMNHIHMLNPNRSNAFYNGSGTTVGASYDYGYSTNYSHNTVNPSGHQSVVFMRSAAEAAPQQVGMGMVQWQRGGARTGGVLEPTMVYESVPVIQGKAAAKRLRLFGVNMDCPVTESDHHHHQHQEYNHLH